MKYTRKVFEELLAQFIDDKSTTFSQRTKAIALQSDLQTKASTQTEDADPPEGSGN